jgi:DNA topoisomerase-1
MTTPDASDAGLRYADDTRPGISRRRAGRGFSYRMPDGSPAPPAVRARAEALVLPPAWTDVWIAADPHGHLQATGRDARGRKQYRYHERWADHVNRLKFDRMVPFGESLPALRARVEADLGGRGLTRDRVVALAVRLLDETLVRVGNAEYARTNGTFGLTTLRDRHVAFDGDGLTFSFVGKSGKAHALGLRDRRLARLVRACRDLPGHDLFQYETAQGRATLGSADVNAYLRETTGDPDVSAKSFRTWGGTVHAAEALAAADAAAPDADPERAVAQAVRSVSEALGNTVAVCRRYYVHPDVLDAYRVAAGGAFARRVAAYTEGSTPAGLRPAEAAVLDLLREAG